jgi:hypothetical protein
MLCQSGLLQGYAQCEAAGSENNGLWKDFHNNDGTHKKEAFAQRLFFAIAHSYCEANDLDISPESNSGSGPVDFKIGKGFSDKINIEMKLSVAPWLKSIRQLRIGTILL